MVCLRSNRKMMDHAARLPSAPAPSACGLNELAGADRGRSADHGDQLALAAHLDPHDPAVEADRTSYVAMQQQRQRQDSRARSAKARCLR
jgi:hypothetical protein